MGGRWGEGHKQEVGRGKGRTRLWDHAFIISLMIWSKLRYRDP